MVGISGSASARSEVLRQIWVDALGFAGIEMHRRILGLAHNAEFESIEDVQRRAGCETNALKFGRHLVVNRMHTRDVAEANDLAGRLDIGAVS